MPPEADKIFAPLKETIEALGLTLGDLLGILACGDAHVIPTSSQILLRHAIDIVNETSPEDEPTFATLIAEIYRRAFFDETAARKHDPEGRYVQDLPRLRMFVCNLVSSFAAHALLDRLRAPEASRGH